MHRPHFRISRRALVVACVTAPLALAAAPALAGGTGDNVLIIIDPSSADSLYVGNYYKVARNVPDRNVLYMAPAAANYITFVGANLDGLFGTLQQREINRNIDYIVVTPGGPYRISAPNLIDDGCVAVRNFAASSIHTMAFIADEISAGNVPVTLFNQYFSSSTRPRSFDSNWKWLNGARRDDPNSRRYFIGAMLGYSGERGNTVEETIAMIDRSVAVDGTHPGGTYYFMDNPADPLRNVRADQYNSAVANIVNLGGAAEKLTGRLPLGRHDCLGIMTGFASDNVEGGDFTILPGAFCDHLTSFAAHFGTASQTKMSRWIVKGASGSVGAVEEPCNYVGKFPRANMHVLYFQGMTMGESYFRSAPFVPFQMLLYGDPLTQPFADIPVVTVPDPPIGVVSGTIQFSASAESPNPDIGILKLDLRVDGLLVDSIQNGEMFTVDTTLLGDGRHDLRIAALDNSRVRVAGRWFATLDVDNRSRSVSLTPTSPLFGNRSAVFSFDLAAAGGEVDEVRLLQNGRVVAAQSGSQASFNLFGQTFGAGLVSVLAEAIYSDGLSARSAPVELDIDFSVDAPSGQAPVAFDYTVTVQPSDPFVLELPATYDDDPAGATYALDSLPSQAAVHSGSGAYRVIVPDEGAAGTDELVFRVQTASGESAPATVTIVYASDCDPCDMNCDGDIDAFDIEPFLGLLFGQDPPCDVCTGDADGDGDIDAFDIEPFLACLFP